MAVIHLRKTIDRDGQVLVTGLPCKQGEAVEITLLFNSSCEPARLPLTARRLLGSRLVGLWKDRTDIGGSAAFARKLRDSAQTRRR